jgi:uncharacterized membrane protein YdjX (TVP38/TMEM64 family)
MACWKARSATILVGIILVLEFQTRTILNWPTTISKNSIATRMVRSTQLNGRSAGPIWIEISTIVAHDSSSAISFGSSHPITVSRCTPIASKRLRVAGYGHCKTRGFRATERQSATLTARKGVPMISEQTVMANDMPSSEPKSGLSVGRIATVLAIGVAVAAFFYFDLGRFLSLQALKDNRDDLLLFTETHSAVAAALFVLAYVAVTGLSLPGAVILTLAGGFLFGAVWGTLFVNLGATAGATLAFLASRYLLRDWVERKFGKWLGPVQQGFEKNAFSYLMTLRLIPLFPFFVVNLVSGLTRMNVGTYLAATALGIIPGSFVYAYAGRQLGTINSLKDIASPGVIGAFVLLGLLALVPSLYKKWSGKPA